jgi:hypothetical protein
MIENCWIEKQHNPQVAEGSELTANGAKSSSLLENYPINLFFMADIVSSMADIVICIIHEGILGDGNAQEL